MDQKFYICEHCGNITVMVKDAGVPVMCCGGKMKEIVPGTSDGALEKHVPVYTVEGNKVKQGSQRKELKPGDKPTVCFALCDGDEVEAVYAYCNLHSLWKA